MKRLLFLVWLAACESPPATNPNPPPAAPGPGVIFSYPRDGQYDVPLGARVLITFSGAPVAGKVATAIHLTSNGAAVAISPTVDGNTVVFAPGFTAGTDYEVTVDAAILDGATNLDGSTPLFSFHTRSTSVIAGRAPTVLTVNGTPPGTDAPLPFLDEATIRVLFSEPLDATTVDGSSVQLLDAAGNAVPGALTVHDVHLTFDPDATLTAGQTYTLSLSSAVHDSGGEALTAVTFPLTPKQTAAADGTTYEQHLTITPPWADAATQPRSTIGAMPANSNFLSSQLVGDNTLGVMAGGLTATLGDPGAFGGPIPMIIKKGQRLDLTSMQIRYGGVLEAGLQTGTVHFTLLSDANGFLTRNPFRPAGQLPDDATAPVVVDLTMDALISGEDAHGNVISTQTVMGIRLLGTSVVDGDQLVVEQVGALDFSTLGVGTAPVNLALRLRSGTKATITPLASPTLISTFPAQGATDAAPDLPIELNFSAPVDVGAITVSQGGTSIPSAVRVDGTTLIVQPRQRLADGTATTVSWAGGTLSFETAHLSTEKPAPPILTALVPGAPCALNASGSCVDGKSDDDGYVPFALAANRDVRALFSQPMKGSTFTLGTSCGMGSVRVERVDTGGTCQAPVPGTLTVMDRELRFTPNTPWTVGATYRLTLVGGSNDTCGPGELCSRAEKPLNTDPLKSAKDGEGGGPDVVITFTGAPATKDSYQPLESSPFADQNGNGYLDADETPTDGNRVAMEYVGRGGIVTGASLNGDDCVPSREGQQSCSYLHATLPVNVGQVLANCPLDAQGRASTVANPCIEIRVYPNLIVGTSLSMNTTAIGVAPINDLPTGMMLMRVREHDGPATGYIMREAGVDDPIFVINQQVYLDSPDLQILGGVGSHDQHSKQLNVTLKGPVTFRPDGRMDVALKNLADVGLSVNIVALGLTGRIDLRIPAGEMRITLGGGLLR